MPVALSDIILPVVIDRVRRSHLKLLPPGQFNNAGVESQFNLIAIHLRRHGQLYPQQGFLKVLIGDTQHGGRFRGPLEHFREKVAFTNPDGRLFTAFGHHTRRRKHVSSGTLVQCADHQIKGGSAGVRKVDRGRGGAECIFKAEGTPVSACRNESVAQISGTAEGKLRIARTAAQCIGKQTMRGYTICVVVNIQIRAKQRRLGRVFKVPLEPELFQSPFGYFNKFSRNFHLIGFS